MAHAFAGRSRHTGYETDHRLCHVVLDPAGTVLFILTADLPDHDHCISVRVVVEHPHDIDVLQAVDRIASNAYTGGLSDVRELTHGFVGQRAGTRYDAHPAFLVDVSRHDADLDFVGRNDTRTVRTDQHGPFSLHAPP